MPEQTGQNSKRQIKVAKVTKNQHWKRGKKSAGPSRSMKLRANAVILSVILTAATALTVNLAHIMLFQHDEYTAMANSRQFGSVILPAARGSIYDTNGTILAQSATVYKIFVDPGLLAKELKMVETRNQELIESAAKKRAAGEVTAQADVIDTNELKAQLAAYLAETLEIAQEDVLEAFAKDSHYVILKKQVEKSKADRIIEYINDIQMPGSSRHIALSAISRESDTKRYYPQNELAAAVIGFNYADGHGFYGVEKYYDSYLSGLDGRTITARDANGNEMPYRYSKTYPAQDGDDVYITIDMALQTYLENEITKLVEEFTPAKRACGLMLNAKTGAVLAMASVRGFDPNSPYEIYDPVRAAEVDLITDQEAHDKAKAEAWEDQWRNKCVTETYIPGSVFKVYTASAGLEENKVDYNNDHFYCNGVITVAGKPIHCAMRSGHKDQTFEQILKNSCNPAFIEIGQRLGKETFFEYFASFGLTEKTGIDLPGETSSYYMPLEKMGPVELAACSYGQTNSLSPIEMVTGYAAVVNGGYLLKPYVVSKIVDKAGNIVLSNEKTVRRQVISEETSAEMRKALQYVVDHNGGSNAYIKGYKIGGKSGTSQKIMGDLLAEDQQYVASYCCFAPADDPEIVLLIMADEPDNTKPYYGSPVAAPFCRNVLEKALPYLGYYPEYTDADQEKRDVTIPMLIDKDLAAAQKTLDELELKSEIIGDGTIINMQTPITGSTVSKGGTVLLYTGTANAEPDPVTVPLVKGMTIEEANEALTEAGLNYVAKGSGAQNVTVLMQSPAAGTVVDRWTVISIDVGSSEDDG